MGSYGRAKFPDVPVNSFELYLPEGKYSAQAANGNLCKAKLTMPTTFTAQKNSVSTKHIKTTRRRCQERRSESPNEETRNKESPSPLHLGPWP